MTKNFIRTAAVLTLLTPLIAFPVQAETLQQFWQQALQFDHSLKSAQQNTAAAEAQLEMAKAACKPGVSLQAGYTVLDNAPASKTSFGELTVGEDKSLSFKATATLPLYTSGKIRSGINAADAALQASRTNESSEIQSLKLKVAEAFVAVLRAKKGLEVANSHVDSLQSHARDVENMFTQDMVSRNDLLTAQVALADAQQQAIKVGNGLDLARSAFNRLLGRPMDVVIEMDELTPPAVDTSLAVLTDRALEQRHELLVLQSQIRALQLQASSIRADTGPQVALTGGYAYQQNEFQVHEGQWSVNLGLQWNVFDGGLIRHKASASERQAIALQEKYADLRSAIALQVRQYWLDVQETGKRIAVTQKAIAQSEENLKVNRDRYENGISTNTEVLDAETLRTQSQNNYANAIYDAVLATLRLKRATGEL
jgi:outer membrane protein TolC